MAYLPCSLMKIFFFSAKFNFVFHNLMLYKIDVETKSQKICVMNLIWWIYYAIRKYGEKKEFLIPQYNRAVICYVRMLNPKAVRHYLNKVIFVFLASCWAKNNAQFKENVIGKHWQHISNNRRDGELESISLISKTFFSCNKTMKLIIYYFENFICMTDSVSKLSIIFRVLSIWYKIPLLLVNFDPFWKCSSTDDSFSSNRRCHQWL